MTIVVYITYLVAIGISFTYLAAIMVYKCKRNIKRFDYSVAYSVAMVSLVTVYCVISFCGNDNVVPLLKDADYVIGALIFNFWIMKNVETIKANRSKLIRLANAELIVEIGIMCSFVTQYMDRNYIIVSTTKTATFIWLFLTTIVLVYKIAVVSYISIVSKHFSPEEIGLCLFFMFKYVTGIATSFVGVSLEKWQTQFPDISAICIASICAYLLVKFCSRVSISSNNDKEILEEVTTYWDLTNREAEVMSMVMKGYTNVQIAQTLFVSENTIKYHLKNLYAKSGCQNKRELIQFVNERQVR